MAPPSGQVCRRWDDVGRSYGTTARIRCGLLLVVPLIRPLAVSYGVNPVHRGIIFLADMQIG